VIGDKLRVFGFILLALLIFSGVWFNQHPVSAENNAPTGTPNNGSVIASGYNKDAQTPSTYPYRTAASVADSQSLTLANLGTIPAFYVNGRPNLSISARFSAPSGTCVVRWVALNNTTPGSTSGITILGCSPLITITLEADPATDTAGLYIGPNVIQDSFGGSEGRLLLVTPPLTGTVTLGLGSY
jgi:hypothetical protein